MPCWKYLIALLLLLLAGCRTSDTRQVAVNRPTPLILISIDGFRADYLKRGLTPTLNALAASGVHAEYMIPSFPTLTFPNHYAMVTGLRPDRNGIVANAMEDDRIPEQVFASGNRKAIEDARWWEDGIPLWISAGRQGLHSGTMFWPGSEAPVHGSHPDLWAIYDEKMEGVTRVDRILAWLALPIGQRPSLMTLYLDTIDDVGHRHGPDSAELNAELRRVDASVRRLIDGLIEGGLEHKVNLVIVSDHGMVATSPERVIHLDDALSDKVARIVSYGVLTGIAPKPGHAEETEAILLRKHENMQCWRKSDLPKRFHYGSHRRVPAILCLANHGWIIASHEWLASKSHFSLGEHGYDNDDPDMRVIFIALGPAFRSGVTLPPFDNVDVYPLLAYLLGIDAEPNDGNFSSVSDALKSPDAASQSPEAKPPWQP